MDIEITLTKKRVLAGILVIGLAAAAAGVGTFALFSDTEQSTNNQVTAGTLDLTVNNTDTAETSLSVSNAIPGEGGTGSELTLKNNGSITGTLAVNVSSIETSENGIMEPENEAGDSSSGAAEIGEHLYVSVDVNGSEMINTTVADLSVNQQISSGNTLTPDGTATVTVGYHLQSSANNTVQSDGATVDLEFILEQA